jgi:transposase
LVGLDIAPGIPGRANRKAPILYDTDLYKQRNRIERMVASLTDCRRIAASPLDTIATLTPS